MIEWVEKEPSVRARALADRERPLPESVANYLATSVTRPSVLCSAACFADIEQQLGAVPVEHGGLLLGAAWYGDDPSLTEVIEVSDAVTAPNSEGTAISLAMGTELWQRARSRVQPGCHVVGWFHSHPGLGAFYSQVDRDTQAAFFREPWHLGLVIDPLLRQSAWFHGPDSEAVEETSVFIIGESDN